MQEVFRQLLDRTLFLWYDTKCGKTNKAHFSGSIHAEVVRQNQRQ